MGNARNLADNLPITGQVAGRNLVINGDMTVAQRSTSISNETANGYRTVDRMYTNASGATYSQSQQTVTVGGETGLPTQFTKYLRHNVTTGNNWSQIYHKIEDVTSVPAGTVTLSFYAKGTTPDSGLTVYCFQNFGSGGSSEVGISVSQTSTLTSTWQRFTIPITIPSMAGKTVGGNSHFYFGIGQGGSTSTNAWTLDITGLQLETGSDVTAFEHEPAAVNLAKCQRYYFQSPSYNAGASGTGADVILYHTYLKAASNWEWLPQEFPVEMRANPTITTSDGVTDGKIGHWTSGGGGSTQGHTPWQVLSKTNHVRVNEYATGNIFGFYYNYKADAEL